MRRAGATLRQTLLALLAMHMLANTDQNNMPHRSDTTNAVSRRSGGGWGGGGVVAVQGLIGAPDSPGWRKMGAHNQRSDHEEHCIVCTFMCC
jgi:hypothetical protein